MFGGRGAAATLNNLRIENNFAQEDGGGIYVERDSNITVDSVIFENNSATERGERFTLGMKTA